MDLLYSEKTKLDRYFLRRFVRCAFKYCAQYSIVVTLLLSVSVFFFSGGYDANDLIFGWSVASVVGVVAGFCVALNAKLFYIDERKYTISCFGQTFYTMQWDNVLVVVHDESRKGHKFFFYGKSNLDKPFSITLDELQHQGMLDLLHEKDMLVVSSSSEE